jgi:ankyrin repeat protein
MSSFDQIGQYGQTGQSSQFTQFNPFGQLNQFSQLNQLNQISHINQLIHSNQLNQLTPSIENLYQKKLIERNNISILPDIGYLYGKEMVDRNYDNYSNYTGYNNQKSRHYYSNIISSDEIFRKYDNAFKSNNNILCNEIIKNNPSYRNGNQISLFKIVIYRNDTSSLEYFFDNIDENILISLLDKDIVQFACIHSCDYAINILLTKYSSKIDINYFCSLDNNMPYYEKNDRPLTILIKNISSNNVKLFLNNNVETDYVDIFNRDLLQIALKTYHECTSDSLRYDMILELLKNEKITDVLIQKTKIKKEYLLNFLLILFKIDKKNFIDQYLQRNNLQMDGNMLCILITNAMFASGCNNLYNEFFINFIDYYKIEINDNIMSKILFSLVTKINGNYDVVTNITKNLINYIMDKNGKIKLYTGDNNDTFLSLLLEMGQFGFFNFFIELSSNGKIDVDINHKDKNGDTILIKCVKLNDINMVKKILSYSDSNKLNLDINIPDSLGITPLMYTILYNYEIIFDFLLECNNISVNSQDIYGNSVLHYALNNIIKFTNLSSTNLFNTAYQFNNKNADLNNRFLLKLINNDKININIVGEYGRTPIIHAIINNVDDKIINMFVGNDKIDLNIYDNTGFNPLMYAMKFNNIQLFNKLSNHKNIDINKQNIMGKSYLLYAIDLYANSINSSNTSNATKFTSGIPLNVFEQNWLSGYDGNNQIYSDTNVSTIDKKLDNNPDGNCIYFVNWLIKHTNLNIQNNLGFTALMYLNMLKTHTHTHKKSFNNNDNNDNNDLDIFDDNLDSTQNIIKSVLDTNKVNLDIKSYDGSTALMYAVKNELWVNVCLLISKGCDHLAKNNKLQSAYDIANTSNNGEKFNYFVSKFKSVKSGWFL